MMQLNIRIKQLSLYLHLGGYRRWGTWCNSQKVNLYGFRSKVGVYWGP